MDDLLISEPPEQSKDVLGSLGDIFTGSIGKYLDVEIEKSRADIYRKPINEDTRLYVRGNEGTAQKGQPSSPFQTVPQWVWLGAVAGVVVLALLSLKRG